MKTISKWREKSNVLKGTENCKKIDWEKAEKYVNRLKIRIVKAKLANKNNLVKRLQYLLEWLLTNYITITVWKL